MASGGGWLMSGCGEPPEGPATCPETEGTTGALGDTGGSGGPCGEPPPQPGMCASPSEPLDAPGQVVRCQGRAEGVILFTQNAYTSQEAAASPKEPEAVPFYLDDEVGGSGGNNEDEDAPQVVRACCTSGVSAVELGTACAYDCGRAACNRALQRVLDRAASEDPSNGACPKVGDLAATCKENVKKSLEQWADEILQHYDECVDAAVSNGDAPNLNLWDRDEVFTGIPLPHMECQGTNLSAEDVGCLYDAVLRVRCVVEDEEMDAAETCEMPANLPPEGANQGDEGSVGAGPGSGSLTGPGAPQGPRPVWFTGGRWHRVCGGEESASCRTTLRALSFRVPGPVQLGPWIRVEGLEGWLTRPLVGVGPVEGYQVLDAAAARARFSGVLVLGVGPGAVAVPVTFNVPLDGPMVVHVVDGGLRVEHLVLSRAGRQLSLQSEVLALEGGA